MLDTLLPAIAMVLALLAASPAGRHRVVAAGACAGLLLLAAFIAGYSSSGSSPARFALAGACVGAAAAIAHFRKLKR